MSTQLVARGVAAREWMKRSAYRWLTREGWLVRYFEVLQKEGVRYSPGVVLRETGRIVEVIAAPSEPGGEWVLSDGLRVKTSEIHELDSARSLMGYD